MPKKMIWLWLALLCLMLPLWAEGDRDFSEHREIWVSGEEEFLAAVAPNTTIHMYSMFLESLCFTEEHAGLNPEYTEFEEVYDGFQLVSKELHNCSNIWEPETRSQILAQPRYANVLTFRNCEEINLQNLRCGHMEEGYCMGGVFNFENCHVINIENCDLWGCGIEGITLTDSSWLSCVDTTIRDCSYSILSLFDSYGVEFRKCVMFNNREFSLLNISNCHEVSFTNCVIYDNSAGDGFVSGYVLNTSSSEIIFSECAIFNNNVSGLLNSREGVSFEHCTVFGNHKRDYRPYYEEDLEEDSDPEDDYYYD
ncbi:MAG TPA: right-handed parallel beta-helix repeat-containing protein [Candidatus Syntrophosphaera sp.]|nr:right-handed parallel beta-helix repeat-containing protein [Candidatus Syntrophosphaera sp.]